MIESKIANDMRKLNSDTTLRMHQDACLTLLKEFDRVCKILNIPYVLFAGTLLGAVRHKGFIPWDDDLDVLMLREDYMRFLDEAEQVLDKNTFYLQKEFSEHWPMFFSKLRLNNTTCLETHHPKDEKMHQGIYIDIFPADSAAKSECGRRIQFVASKVVIAKSLDRRGYETRSIAKRVFMALCKMLPRAPFFKLVTSLKRNKDSNYIHSFFGAASSYSKNIYPRTYFENTIQIQFEDGCYPVPKEYDELLTILYGDYMTPPLPEQRKIKQHAILVDVTKSYEHYRKYHKEMVFKNITRSIR